MPSRHKHVVAAFGTTSTAGPHEVSPSHGVETSLTISQIATPTPPTNPNATRFRRDGGQGPLARTGQVESGAAGRLRFVANRGVLNKLDLKPCPDPPQDA